MGEDFDMDAVRAHFEVLADALAAPGIRQQPEIEADKIMPLHAPEWLWEAWEQHELQWAAWEHTYAEIHALPDTAPGECPAEEEYVFTREDNDRERDLEAADYDPYEED